MVQDDRGGPGDAHPVSDPKRKTLPASGDARVRCEHPDVARKGFPGSQSAKARLHRGYGNLHDGEREAGGRCASGVHLPGEKRAQDLCGAVCHMDAAAINPLGNRAPTSISFWISRRMVPEDALMQKGYEACVDWMLEPETTVEELKKYPAGYTVNDVKPLRSRSTGRTAFQRLREKWSSLRRSCGRGRTPFPV